ncbi:MAG: hypothetical protein WDM87_00255 [Terracidiphilus sp.]
MLTYFGPPKALAVLAPAKPSKRIVVAAAIRNRAIDFSPTRVLRRLPDTTDANPFRLFFSAAMKDAIHVSKENYLKAILEAEAEGRQVIPAMLAHWLEVSRRAVTMAIKRLKRDGCVKGGRRRHCAPHRGRPRDEHTARRCAIISSSVC